MDRDQRLRITEIFYSLQGESSFAGRPCVFVRLTGCNLRCVWCDSSHTFQGGRWMTLGEILEQVSGHGCPLVEVTGGEPLLQEGVHPLMTALCDAGHQVLLETSGSLPLHGVDSRVIKIMDLKCPDSGESEHNLLGNLEALNHRDEIKFVIASERDYRWAAAEIRRHRLDARAQPPLISPVHDRLDLPQLSAWILEDRLQVRLQLQLHKAIWGPDAIGV